MEKILFFHYCAIPIFIIILVAAVAKKATKGKANKCFLLLTGMSLAATLIDLGIEFFCARVPLSGLEVFLTGVLSYAYFIIRDSSIMVYLLYTYFVTKTEYRLRYNVRRYPLAALYILMLVMFALNIFTNKIFTITSETGYARGEFLFVIYPIVFIFAVWGIIHLIHCRSLQDGWKWLAYISIYVLNFAAAFVQYFMPQFVVEMFATAIALLMIILLVFRPEEVIDSSVGLLSWKAYKSLINTVVQTKQPVHIVVIKFVNANNIRAYLGEQRYNNYIIQSAAGIEKYCRDNNFNFDIYFEAPGVLYIVFDAGKFDADINEVMKELYKLSIKSTEDIENAGARLIPRLCSISHPDDLDNYDDIIHFGHEIYGLIPYGQIYTKASDIVGTHYFKLESNMDSILERAITEHRLEMYYQPIYSEKHQKFISAEALLRLKDREFGAIAPGVFIPAAESRGLILPIGEFVIDEVFKFISNNDLSQLGLSFIEINLSVAQCLQPDLPDKVEEMRKKYGISPRNVNFELTESSFDNIGEIIDNNLKIMSAMGYTFSLDDYGTGYSNIKRVTKLPFKIIKIDKSLVDDMPNADGISIIRNTIRMMKDIRKEVVAEGVETKSALEGLRKMNCDYIQGFYFSEPLPADEFIKFIKENNK